MDDVEVIRRCMRRDFAAFELLYQGQMQRALRTAFLFTRSHPAAEDAVQEAFIQVWRRIDTLRDPGSFQAWFYRILHHAAFAPDRRGQSTIPLDLHAHDRPDINAAAPDERVVHDEELRELRAAITTLPESHRIPVVLRYYTKLSDAEIASVLDIPAGTVKSRLYSARIAIHETLARTSITDPSDRTTPKAGKERPSHG